MVAAGKGHLEMAQQLLNLGASISLKASNNWTALDWALNCNETATAELIESYM